jgi:hypothetical protein
MMALAEHAGFGRSQLVAGLFFRACGGEIEVKGEEKVWFRQVVFCYLGALSSAPYQHVYIM